MLFQITSAIAACLLVYGNIGLEHGWVTIYLLHLACLVHVYGDVPFVAVNLSTPTSAALTDPLGPPLNGPFRDPLKVLFRGGGPLKDSLGPPLRGPP